MKKSGKPFLEPRVAYHFLNPLFDYLSGILDVKKPSVKRASEIYSICSVTQSGIELMSVEPKNSAEVIKDKLLISQLNNS